MKISYPLGFNLVLLFLVIFVVDVCARHRPPFQPGPWKPARATFYGNPDGSGTFEGTCGYVNAIAKDGTKGYGLMTAALSVAMFKDGLACGGCYELKCEDVAKGCKPGAAPITITATNLCPGSGWCAAPQEHFDLTQKAYLQMAEYKAGVVPIQYRRIPCIREGGIKFTISSASNPYFLLVLVWNIAGAGEIESVQIKGSKGEFMDMKRNWGENWETRQQGLVGQPLSFRVKTTDGKVSTSHNMVPADWKFGQTYEGKNIR